MVKKTIVVIILTLFLIISSVRVYHRFDLTNSKVYSLSSISSSLYKEIPQPIIIKYYLSPLVNDIVPGIDDIKNILKEFETTSHNKIRVEIIDPAKKGIPEELDSMGVLPEDFKIVSENREKIIKLYSTVVIQFLDRYKIIQGVYSPNSIEYQVVSRIREIIQNRRRVIGVLIGNRKKTLDSDYHLFKNYVASDFDILTIKNDTELINSINVLVVIGAKDLGADDVNKISSFIDSGGNVLFCVDGVDIDLEHNLKPTPIYDNLLIDLLANYGITIKRGLVIDPFAKEFRTPKEVFGSIAWQSNGIYPEWVKVKGSVSKSNPVTANFAGLDLLWASPLIISDNIKKSTDILFRSSSLSWIMDKNFNTSPFEVSDYASGPGKEKKSYILGAAVTRGKSRFLVVGDSDFLSDVIQYSDSYYNLKFVLNSLDWLSQNEDFMNIRTRGDRPVHLDIFPFEKTRAIFIISRTINSIIIPLLVLITGLYIFIREKKGK